MKVAVIGAGLVGLTTAYYLNRQGADVVVFDRAARSGLGASHANAGMLTPGLSEPWNAPGAFRQLISYIGNDDAPMLLRLKAIPGLLRWGALFFHNSTKSQFLNGFQCNAALAKYSLECLDALEKDAGIAFWRSRKGTLKLCRDPKSLEAIERIARTGAEFGTSYQRLDKNAVLEREPSLLPIADKIVGGIFHPEDGSGDAFLFCTEVERLCREGGVEFRFDLADVGLHVNKRAIMVEAGNERLDFDAVIVAAGQGSVELLRRVGIALPIAPVKGYSISIQTGDWHEGPSMPVVDNDLHIAITPIGNTIRVAGTAEFAGADDSLPPARIENLKRLFQTTFPTCPHALRNEDIAPWTGFRPFSPDGMPMIGRTHYSNLFVNTGHGHLGWTQAAGSSRALVDLMRGRKPAVDLLPYDPSRFG